MKKKYVAIIALTTISAVFGGLIYCGVSAFPELLNPEQEQAIVEEKNYVAPIISNNYDSFANVSETKPVLEEGANAFVPTFYSKNIIILDDVFATSSNETVCHFVEYTSFTNDETTVEKETSVDVKQNDDVKEEIIEATNTPIVKRSENKVSHIRTVKRHKAVTKTATTTNRGMIEATLLVTVAVEALSLFARQKKISNYLIRKILNLPQQNIC